MTHVFGPLAIHMAHWIRDSRFCAPPLQQHQSFSAPRPEQSVWERFLWLAFPDVKSCHDFTPSGLCGVHRALHQSGKGKEDVGPGSSRQPRLQDLPGQPEDDCQWFGAQSESRDYTDQPLLAVCKASGTSVLEVVI